LSQLSSQTLMERGRTLFEQRQADQALACFTTVSSRYHEKMEDAEVELCIRAMNNCGCVCKFYYFDYPRAYEYFSQACDLCEKHQLEDRLLPIIMVNLGDLLNDYGENYDSQTFSQQARETFERCMQRAMQSKNWELMTTAFFNLANQNFELDLKKYQMLFAEDIPDDTPDLAYVRLQYKGIAAVQSHDYQAARNHFRQQLPVISTRWAPERDSISTYLNIARTYQLENNYACAIDSLLAALHLAEKHNVADIEISLYAMLSEVYALNGDDTQASSCHTHYLEMKENAASNRLATIGEMNYVDKLKKQEQKSQQMARLQRYQQVALAVAALVLLAVVVYALLLWRRNHHLTKQSKNVSVVANNVPDNSAIHLSTKGVSENQPAEAEDKYSRSYLTDSQREALMARIQDILDKPDIYCQQDFSLGKLAKMVDSNTTYVSQVINEKYGIAFSNVIGKLRVQEACRRMNDVEHFGNFTIEGIAGSVGFKSRTAFFNSFKRETGLTPSEYQRRTLG